MKRQSDRLPVDQREKDSSGGWNDYLAVAVGLLFVTAMLLSFRINDWVMQTFAWDY